MPWAVIMGLVEILKEKLDGEKPAITKELSPLADRAINKKIQSIMGTQ